MADSTSLHTAGDTQALAPATEEQAAEAAAPEAGAEGAAEDDAMAGDAWDAEPLPHEQSAPSEDQVHNSLQGLCIVWQGGGQN